MKQYNLAILGATGAVGQEFINLLNERDFPFANLKLLASARSAGKELTVRGKTYKVEEAKADSFNGIDVALFAGGSISKEFAPIAVKAGAVVIDNSSTYRMDPDVPLIVPEVNPQDIQKHHGIIANPNCSTIIMVMALKPIYDLARIKRIIVSTYQAASGAGKDGLDELERQIQEAAAGKEMEAHIFPSAGMPKHYPLALNLIPQIDVFLDNLYTKEEMKMVNETKKIFSDPEMRVTATTVRVPVYRSHSESVNVELEHDVDLAEIRKALANFPGVVLQDDPSQQVYPMPLYTSGLNDVYVGRLRRDESAANSFNFWCVGDQIRKGAALNTLQIAETMVKNGWL
ncbi:aspartate-semialdehyde dehydrogenase [Acidaminococcus sp. NSJ-142]|jgi:aspartate-semialdehyde dehydrogenase|uniref:aspartate-semialdehyde dehydrogenase n=1 Tax=Acidaminococcus TaxID=904 RepID=UPI000CF8B1E0|nr:MULTISPECIES: aspartate-semialdehyde dehydrogenase [Acidaminococcus]MCD2435526.1 aspartate-semialdehyde dehydrogenase [Acidaminococcus hominis]MCH4095514.1 aspartate-semialdehyde dehydrogenase [Acidaminococcus provencensis]RHK01806.1 aspartate-semialdehyde dehydrogenase [Acidaminococcus sp. AM05-11]